MAAIKLDENVPDLVSTVLRDGGHDVALARDEHLVGVPDERLLAAANEEARAIISLDRGFANILRHSPQTTAGIIVIRLHTQTLPLVRQAAERLRKLLADESVRGCLWVLDEARLRIWPRDSPG